MCVVIFSPCVTGHENEKFADYSSASSSLFIQVLQYGWILLLWCCQKINTSSLKRYIHDLNHYHI